MAEVKQAEPGKEPERKPREQAPKTKEYALKEGAELTTIVEGEHKTLRGVNGGSITVHLTEDQAKAFQDKLDMNITPQARNMKEATTLVVGEQTGGAATIPEAAAQAGLAEGISGESEDDVDNHDAVDRPAGSRTADVSKVGTEEVKSSGTKGAEKAGNAGAGQASSPAAGASQTDSGKK
jgi:hypothetical protein